MKRIIPILLTLLFSLTAHAQVLTTATSVDISRYVGKWYAITSLPQFFTKNCLGQTAEYEVINEKTISVLNTCLKRKGSSDIKGTAVVKNQKTNAELVVTFDSFFTRLFRVKGDYTIIKLDPDYEYSLVGSKDRKSLWLLARQPEISEDVLKEYIEVAKKEGFPVENLVKSQF